MAIPGQNTSTRQIQLAGQSMPMLILKVVVNRKTMPISPYTALQAPQDCSIKEISSEHIGTESPKKLTLGFLLLRLCWAKCIYLDFHNSEMSIKSADCRPQSVDTTTCQGCHLWPVQERSPLPVHKPGINFLYLFVTRTVSRHLKTLLFTAAYDATDN